MLMDATNTTNTNERLRWAGGTLSVKKIKVAINAKNGSKVED